LYHSIPDRRDAKRTSLAVRLRDPHPANRLRPIALRPQLVRQFPQLLLLPLDCISPACLEDGPSPVGRSIGWPKEVSGRVAVSQRLHR
jgi:hypothetical protein